MTLPVILDRLVRLSGPVQEDILALLETVVFTQNHVPLNELSKLATIITICNDATFRLCLRTLVKFINFDAKFAGEEILSITCTLLSHLLRIVCQNRADDYFD